MVKLVDVLGATCVMKGVLLWFTVSYIFTRRLQISMFWKQDLTLCMQKVEAETRDKKEGEMGEVRGKERKQWEKGRMVNPAKQSNIVAFFGFKNPDLLKVYPWNCQHCVREVPTVLLPFPHPGWAGSPYHRRAALYLPPVTFPSPLALLILSVVLTQQDDSPTEDIKELLQPTSTFLRANLSNPTPTPILATLGY